MPGAASLHAALAVAGALACAAGGLHGARAFDLDRDPQRVPRPPRWAAAAQPPSPYAFLGHAPLAADVAMARAQVYFGAELETRGAAPQLSRYLDAAVDLDPSARERYLRGAAMLVYSGPVITADGVVAADRLLERGTRALPEDWELWFQLGFDRLYELPRLVEAGDPRRAGWRRDGVAAIARAAELDGAPPWLGRLATDLVREAR